METRNSQQGRLQPIEHQSTEAYKDMMEYLEKYFSKLKINEKRIMECLNTIMQDSYKGIFNKEIAEELFKQLEIRSYIVACHIIEESQVELGKKVSLDSLPVGTIIKIQMIYLNAQFVDNFINKTLEEIDIDTIPYNQQFPDSQDSYINRILKAVINFANIFVKIILNKSPIKAPRDINEGVSKVIYDTLNELCELHNVVCDSCESLSMAPEIVNAKDEHKDECKKSFISNLDKVLQPYYSVQKSKLNKNSTTSEPYEKHNLYQDEATIRIDIEEALHNLTPSHSSTNVSSRIQNANVANHQEAEVEAKVAF